MMHVASLYRHPIKAIGHERLAEVLLSPGARMPGDRIWAVAHEGARPVEAWAPCANFVRGAKSASLMAVRAETTSEGLRLTHPERPEITVDPKTDGDRLVEWVRPICDPGRAAPAKLVPAPGGMTDNEAPWLTLLSHGSRDALGRVAGRALSPLRFRGNIWIEGAEPWAELSWMGRTLEIGDVRLRVTEPVERCVATHVDPETGRPDADLLKTLETTYGHRDFGVFVEVIAGGRVAPGDTVTLL